MPIQKSQFINQFAQQALDERISLFLGAGGSCDAGYPNWASLFEPLAQELGLDTNESTDYYKLAQYYSNRFGQAELRKRINERINRNEYKSSLIEELIDVGFTNIWTTNFDNAVEHNFQEQNMLINKVFKDSDLSNIDIHKRINVFKMNGDVSNLDGIIATQSDYEKYIESHHIMLMFFKRELISSTFLFVGYSFTDHLVLDCLSEIQRYLGESANYHYTILKKEKDNPYFEYFVEDLEKRYHIRALIVDEYHEIPLIIKELNEKIRNKRVFISGAFSSYSYDIEEYSHNLSKSLSASLLGNDYRIVNGIGRRFGTHLIGYANEYLAKEGVKNIEKHLIIRPFVGLGNKAIKEKRCLRQKTIGKCGAAIFVFGDSNGQTDNSHSGIWEEFEIACQQHKIIIPISYPAAISEEIWKKVNSDMTRYPYLEGKMEWLISSVSSDKTAQVIVHILDSVRRA
jgi:hypothetical protein